MSDTTTKKPRALPRVWKTFYRLTKGENFYLKDTKTTLVSKTSFLTAREYEYSGCLGVPVVSGPLHFVAPWTRVKTTALVREVRVSRASVLHRPQPSPVTTICGNNQAITVAEAAIEVPNGNQQPNSDNAVTGPTS